MPTLYTGRWIRGFHRFTQSTLSLMATTPEAQRRAMILMFWKKHGLQATRDAFHVSRATLFAWQSRLQKAEGRLAALEPRSRRPRTVRVQTTPHRIVLRIIALRELYPHYGKEKIRVLLLEEGIRISPSTIGRIIARNHLPGASHRWVARKKRIRRTRLPTGFVTSGPGGLVSLDAIILQQGRDRKYVVTALDHHTHLGMAHAYSTLSSRQARDMLRRMGLSLGVRIERVLTDNGSEFFGVFDEACKTTNITHFWTYPRSPKMNARTERFNRTIQEEARLPSASSSVDAWNRALAAYLLEYNFQRPHTALDYRRPIEAYCACRSSSPEESRMCWTHTRVWGEPLMGVQWLHVRQAVSAKVFADAEYAD